MVWQFIQQRILAGEFFKLQQWSSGVLRACFRQLQQWLYLHLRACFQQLQQWLCLQLRARIHKFFKQRLLAGEQLFQRLVLILGRLRPTPQ